MAKNEFNEPEELGGDYDPMGAPINEKPYTKPNVKINPTDLSGDIPEPSFQAPLLDLNEPPKFDEVKREKVEREPFNKEMNDLPKKEKEVAASHVANMIMQLYEGAHVFANKGMIFNEKKLNKLAQEGEVDFSIRIPYSYESNDTMSAADFIQEFNNQQKDSLVVSQEFKDEVTPILERVLRKRGVGMTDEQMLIFMFGKDIAIKGSAFFAARQQMGDIISMLKEQTEAMKGGNFSSQQRNTTPPPPQPTPTQEVFNDTPTYMGTDFEEENDTFEEQEEIDDNVLGSVQEQVEAQLQRKTVAQLRREELERAKASYKPKTIGGKRGRKKKS